MSEMKVTDRRWWARGDQPADSTEPTADVRLKPTYVEELEARLAAKDAELRELLAKYRGASEEFDQARARLRKEVTKDVERGRRALLVGFLEVLDNLDRALAAAAARPDDLFVQGVSLVQQQFLGALAELGVRRIDPAGEPFDPVRHEAVTTMAASPDVPSGTITGVIRPGYLIGDDVLRTAQVAVAG